MSGEGEARPPEVHRPSLGSTEVEEVEGGKKGGRGKGTGRGGGSTTECSMMLNFKRCMERFPSQKRHRTHSQPADGLEKHPSKKFITHAQVMTRL